MGNVLVSGMAVVRGAHLYPSLPAECSVPVQFGLFGEVMSSWKFRSAYLIFPVSALLGVVLPALIPQEEPYEPSSRYRALHRCMTQATLLTTSGLLLACTEQVPKIVKGEQKAFFQSDWFSTIWQVWAASLLHTMQRSNVLLAEFAWCLFRRMYPVLYV